jgi:hypothetical protein
VTYVHNNIEIRFSDSLDYQVVEINRYDSNLDLALLVMDNTQGKTFEVNMSNLITGQKLKFEMK